MTRFDLTVELPDKVAAKAAAANLLTPEAISALIQQELQRQREIAELFAALERLDAVDLPQLSEAEVEAEVNAARHARRFDTNIVISGLLWRGSPRRILNMAREGKISLIASSAMLAELSMSFSGRSLLHGLTRQA
jgi:predicted proteasome-type protease